jgi:hypothetical protein
MNYDTTRRFSRSLSDAFPEERAHCIECPPKKNYGRKAVNWTLVLAVWFLVTLLAMENMK